MSTLGHKLVTERLRQNLDLDQVARVTRITPRLLKAIELDDFEQLPGRVFARNFVRQYGQFLGLDANALVVQFDREQSPAEPEEPSRFTPLSVPRGFSLNLPAVADVLGNSVLTSFLAFVATLGLCAVGVWTFDNWGLSRRPALAMAKRSPPAPSLKPVSPSPKPVSPSPAVNAPVATDTAAPVAEMDSPAIGPAGATVHVLLAASDRCWTRITADGKVLFEGVLNSGETRQVNAASVVDLRAGNAGALALKLNGSEIPPLGPKGQIRSVVLTSSGAHVLTPIPDPFSEPL